ncbi:MAG: class I SAM-dependent methyltransferase [Candidatus Omnitrophota bacterium]
MSWDIIFEDDLKRQGSVLAAFAGCLVQNWYFAYKLQQYLPKDKACRILEAGAGTGYLAFYLSSLGHDVVAMDIDTDFMEKANSALRSNVSILRQDIRTYPYASPSFDLIYNIGVMEHFFDEDIIRIFKNFRSVSDMLIFAVPNFNIPYSYGDERYLSRRHWKRLLRLAGWRTKEIFGYNRRILRKYLTGFVCIGDNQVI